MIAFKPFLLYFLFNLFSKSQEAFHGEYIFELSDANFEDKIKTLESAIVVYYSNYKNFLEFLQSESDTTLNIWRNEEPVYLVYVDCNESGKEICKNYNVKDNMDIKIFHNGKKTKDYKGPALKSWVIKYLKTEDRPSYIELNNQAELKKFTASQDNIFLIGYFQRDLELKNAFIEVANNLKHVYNFAIVKDLRISQQQNSKEGIILHRPVHLRNKYESSNIAYTGGANTLEIENFISDNKHGLVGLQKNYNPHEFIYPITIIYFDIDLDNPQGLYYCRNKILQVAYKFLGKMNFAISSKNILEKDVRDPYVVTKISEREAYEMDKDFSIDNLESFLTYILTKNEEKQFKLSEDIPVDSTEYVVTVVAKNFKEAILNCYKDVMLILYNSQQPIDKELFGISEELGDIFKDEDIVIAKMDISKNDVIPPFYFYSNPSIFWLGKYNKENPEVFSPETYSIGEFLDFIERKSTTGLKFIDDDINYMRDDL